MKNKSMKILLTTSHRGKRSVRKYYSDPIPVDLLIDIFSLIPAKSIARFRCVSKQWASIIGRPDFTELFLTKSSTRPRLLFTFKANGKLLYYSSPQPHNLTDDDSCLVATRYHPSYPEILPTDKCSHVRGFALLQKYHGKGGVICNPVTGELITLPIVLLKPNNLPTPDKVSGFYFGYDPIGKQFKVLCMTTSPLYEIPNTHMVSTLENGEKPSWRRIESEFRFVENCRTKGNVCINGVIYFGADLDLSTVIVSFDVRSEKFGFINTFEDMSLGDIYRWTSLSLFNYKGKLGILHPDEYRDRELLFWVLEDGGNHKWSKHVYRLSHSGDKIVRANCFVGMTSTCEMVWSPYPAPVPDPFYLFFYNLESKSFTRVEIQGFKKGRYHKIIYTFLDYVENMNFM